jgi:hypothetical protein
MWPLLSVYVGALVAWVGGRAYDQTRRGHVVRRVKLKPLDVVVYCGALAFGAVAFLLPVYTATNFGTWEQYLSVFVAGIVGKVVVDQAFTPLEPVVAPAAGDTAPRLPLLRSARHRERHLEPGRSKTALRVGSGSGVAADENASRERHPQQREGASTASRSWCIAPTWFARVPPLPPRERKASVSAPVPETPAWDEHRARGAGVI